MELNETQKEILRKIATSKRPLTLSLLIKAKNIREDDVISLVNMGIIEEYVDSPRARKSKYRLTDEGEKIYQTLPPPEKKPKTARKSARSSVSSEQIEQIVKRAISQAIVPLITVIQEIQEALVESGIIQKKPTSLDSTPTMTIKITLEEFKKRLQQEYERIDRETRSGGMVKIPLIWKAMSAWISREEFVNFLFQLEEQRIIDLQIASDERLVDSPDEGIRHPTRGLIYYIVWR